jgi:G3E family GTPase
MHSTPAPSTPGPVPLSIVTGFLGSGKTTFLNWLLSQPGTGRIVVVVNEFGEIGLDHQLIATPVENIVLIEGGCLCCEVRGDLVQTLRDLRDRCRSGEIPAFDQVVVETTGLSNPIPILQTVLCDETVRDDYRLHRIVTLVDTVNSAAQMRMHPEAIRQVAVADLLLLSKRDLPETGDADQLEAELRAINPGAALVTSRRGCPEGLSAQDVLSGGDVHGETAFLRWLQAGEDQVRRAMQASGQSSLLAPSGGMTSLSHALRPLGVESFAIRRPGEISSTGLVMWLNLLSTMKGEHLLRLKAILNVEGRPVALHAAQTIVHEPVQLAGWPGEDRDSRIVVISRGSIRREFERSLEHLDLRMPEPSATPRFDPAAYQRFLSLAQAFTPGAERTEDASTETP